MEIIIAKNYRELSRLAAEAVIRQIRRKPRTVLGLPTGHTPIELYHDLVAAYQTKKISFRYVSTFNLDEYVGLNQTDPRGYHSYMRKNLFSKVDLKPENEHILDGRASNVKKECARFEAQLRKVGGIDLLILGIGKDGHIGFNEPGSKINSKTRTVKLSESTRRANAKYFGSAAKVPRRALTMGIGTIMQAKKIILLAHGKEKAAIVKQALSGKISAKIPASFLRQHRNLIVILDKAAASKLK